MLCQLCCPASRHCVAELLLSLEAKLCNQGHLICVCQVVRFLLVWLLFACMMAAVRNQLHPINTFQLSCLILSGGIPTSTRVHRSAFKKANGCCKRESASFGLSFAKSDTSCGYLKVETHVTPKSSIIDAWLLG